MRGQWTDAGSALQRAYFRLGKGKQAHVGLGDSEEVRLGAVRRASTAQRKSYELGMNTPE